jgi:hypothetical protein
VLSNDVSEAYEEEDSIPLHKLYPPKAKKKPIPSFLNDLPLPPLPAAVAQHRYTSHANLSDSALSTEDDKFASYEQGKPPLPSESSGQPNSVFANVKNAFAAISSPADVSTPPNWPGHSHDKGKQQAPDHAKGYHSSLGAAPSGSLAPNSGENNQSRNPFNRRPKHGYDSYTQAIPFPDLKSTTAPSQGSSAQPRQSTKTTGALSNAASLPEGSTVGNIVNHYVRSEIIDDSASETDVHSEYDLGDGNALTQQFRNRAVDHVVWSSSMLNGQTRLSALDVRKQRRAERLTGKSNCQPLEYALPGLPKPFARMDPSTSQGIGHSSSYGDTSDILGLAESSQKNQNKAKLSRSNGRSDHSSFAKDDSALPRNTHLDPKSPFIPKSGPQVVVSKATDEEDIYNTFRYVNRAEDRQPLEREVSEALRRASNFSTYSDGSIASSMLEHYANFQSQASSTNGMEIIRRRIDDSSVSVLELDEETRRVAVQAQAFYERGAIPSIWIADNAQNQVRIPIQRHNPFPTPAISPEDDSNSRSEIQKEQNDAGDDTNDWETVGESAFGTDFKGSTPGMLGDIANRAGSSLANTSDDGTASTYIPEISNYGSTERIAQHPGNIQYFGDYRQRDLKKSKIPVFLPVYGEHKVNGYLADSNRLRAPRSPFNHSPRPLDRLHTNPFTSPPPDVMTKGSGRKHFSSSYRDRSAPKSNHFPPSASVKTDLSSEDGDDGEQYVAPRSLTPSAPVRHARAAFGAENYSWPFNRMNGSFTEPEPAINSSNPTFLKPIIPISEQDRPSSWQHIMAYARGDSVEGYNDDGSRKDGASVVRIGDCGIMEERSFTYMQFSPCSKVETDGFVDQKTYSGKRGLNNPQERKTLVKGPPGAFYHGLTRPKTNRSQSDRAERPARVNVPYRNTNANHYPTNTLRPLSLVPGRQSRRVTSIDISPGPKGPNDNPFYGPNPSMNARPDDFRYISPLAPPRDEMWRRGLYTKEQMATFREQAKVDGIVSRKPQDPDTRTGLFSNRTSFKSGLSVCSKHLWEAPRLFQWPREPSARTDLASRKNKISWTLLCLCNLLPPLLILFAKSYMDGIIAWWTSGESIAFPKRFKTYAWIMLGVWVLVFCCLLVTFLIVWFTTRHTY